MYNMYNFIDWLDAFIPFLKGYYMGLTIEKRARPGIEIISDAINAYKCCNGPLWYDKEEEAE